jgi:hypothetical protein
MEKRAFERIPLNLHINHICDDLLHTGTITNCSEKGMYISTKVIFPCDPQFEILIPLKKDVLKVFVKITRLEKTGDVYDGMGVELLNPPQNYLDFVNSL